MLELQEHSSALLKVPTCPAALCNHRAVTRLYDSELMTQWFFPVLLEVVWGTDLLWLMGYEPERDREDTLPSLGHVIMKFGDL